MEFIGKFIGTVTELDDFYCVRFLEKGIVGDVNILCSINKRLDITEKEIEQYIIDEKRIVISSILLQNIITNGGTSKEPELRAELQVSVYAIEDANEACMKIRRRLHTIKMQKRR